MGFEVANFNDERTLVRLGSGDDGVDRLDDSGQRRIRADSHVCAAEVVVDRTDNPSNIDSLTGA